MYPLISEGVRHGTHAALVSVSSHYDGVDFKIIKQGRTLGRSESNILTVKSAAALGRGPHE